MQALVLSWQRLLVDGATCPRCAETERELENACSFLQKVLAPLGIEVVLEKKELSLDAFRGEPLSSNALWINGRPLEEWIKAKVGQSPCCDVCGSEDCRTLEIEGKEYETVPAELIIEAALRAAAEMLQGNCCS